MLSGWLTGRYPGSMVRISPEKSASVELSRMLGSVRCFQTLLAVPKSACAQWRWPKTRGRLSVQFRSNSRGWLHRAVPRKRHQMRHLCELPCLLAKHETRFHSLYPSLITINVSNKPGILLSLKANSNVLKTIDSCTVGAKCAS